MWIQAALHWIFKREAEVRVRFESWCRVLSVTRYGLIAKKATIWMATITSAADSGCESLCVDTITPHVHAHVHVHVLIHVHDCMSCVTCGM